MPMDKENRIPVVVVGVTGHRAIRAQDKAALAVTQDTVPKGPAP